MALQLFKIADVLVESPVATVTFSSIPSGYTDLIVKISGRVDGSTAPELSLKINSTTGGYSTIDLVGNGSIADTSSTSGNNWLAIRRSINGSSTTANVFSNTEIYIPNYTSSTNKSVSADGVIENNATAGYSVLCAGLSTVTSAITSLTFSMESTGTNFVANSTFTLYGVL